jgi:Putative Tad-like Flp pilus-assembly
VKRSRYITRRRAADSGAARRDERGIVVLLVAVVLLFIIAAMAALAIDLVSFYTARSEAQLTADAGALAGARALANSGMTSSPSDTTLATNAQALATAAAQQAAVNNKVGDRLLTIAEVAVSFPTPASGAANAGFNPQVQVQVQRNDLPTFFARIWGRATVTVSATAKAEAYNASADLGVASGVRPPVAPTCVKPWLMPNLDPNPENPGDPLFDPATGAIHTRTTPLLGVDFTRHLKSACSTCTVPPAPSRWRYYPAEIDPDPTNPNAFSAAPVPVCPDCGGLTTTYQQAIAGCVQKPIACNSQINLDTAAYPNDRDTDTMDAVNALTRATANLGDSLDFTAVPTPPYRILAGGDNPVVQSGAITAGTQISVSNSIVTVPIYNSTAAAPTSPVQVIGFAQIFLNSDGQATVSGGAFPLRVRTAIVNLIGCGTGLTATPIVGNGPSAVPVRLITN